MFRPIIHMILHFIVPAATAKLMVRWRLTTQWKHAWLVMMATMLVDIDHLLADPLYAPNRCSIGFHPLHTPIPIVGYVILCWFPKTRLIGLGLVIHMLLDGIDCALM